MELFGVTADGRNVNKYTLTCGNLSVEILDYGATIRSFKVVSPDKRVTDIVLGYDTIAEYEKLSGYLGAVIGRNAGRIAKCKFTIDGKEYNIGKNDGENSLHGGMKGFDKAVFRTVSADKQSIVFEHISPDGDEGHPAELKLTVKYTLTEQGLQLEYSAVSDATTYANFTNHAYFNLDGAGDQPKSIYNTYIKLDSDYYLYAGSDIVPTGERVSVINTPYDLRVMTKLGDVIESDYKDLLSGGGFDNYFLFVKDRDMDKPAASAYSEQSKIGLNVITDAPGITFYSGNFMGGEGPFAYRGAFCFETQNPPNSPNIEEFREWVTVRPDKPYYSKTLFAITAK